MKITNTTIVEKSGKYFLIEEIKNSRKVSKLLKENYPKLHKDYKFEPYVYRNSNTDVFVDIISFEGCKFVNLRNITGNYPEKKHTLDKVYVGGSAIFVYWKKLKAY